MTELPNESRRPVKISTPTAAALISITVSKPTSPTWYTSFSLTELDFDSPIPVFLELW
jgi:hypothetical protein